MPQSLPLLYLTLGIEAFLKEPLLGGHLVKQIMTGMEGTGGGGDGEGWGGVEERRLSFQSKHTNSGVSYRIASVPTVEICGSSREESSFQAGETKWVSEQEKFLGGSQNGLFTGEIVNPGEKYADRANLLCIDKERRIMLIRRRWAAGFSALGLPCRSGTDRGWRLCLEVCVCTPQGKIQKGLFSAVSGNLGSDTLCCLDFP